MSEITSRDRIELPVLLLRDAVVYPHMVMPLFVGRDKSIRALEAAMANNKQILLTAQKEATNDNPHVNDIYRIGTVSTILQLLKLPDGTVKVLVEGTQRGRINAFVQEEPCFIASVSLIETLTDHDSEIEVLVRSVLSQFEVYVKLNKKVPPEILTSLSGIDHPARLVDTIAAHIALKVQDKQTILEIADLKERLTHLLKLLEGEIELLKLENKMQDSVKRNVDQTQKEYFLREKLKVIREELGENDTYKEDVEELKKKIEAAGMTEEAKAKAMTELNKLSMMSPMSPESTNVRNYIDWLINVPWKSESHVSHNIDKAEAILDADHYGLEKVKERILEYLAVQTRVKKLKGPILCLVGPPGVGKTSLGQSIARATNRKFVRMSLGGVRDEAEIRGHRRTYIGSMPGRILQKMAKAGVRNPLFLLDEIDKMAMDFRGDPASALLEVLDPEQNNTFNDHYLEVDYDLSDVLFVATANSMNMPGPLLDPMEVIRLSGYTEDEKLHIASKYLIPKEMKENGVKKTELTITDEAILDVIRYYTREAGVRSLEREISKICRKVVKALLQKKGSEKTKKVADDNPESLKAKKKTPTLMKLTPKDLEKYLGVKKYRYGVAEAEDRVGEVTGLAWTEVGGEILTIEAAAVLGKGKIERTGKLGEVMQESIQAAMTVVRSRAKVLGIPEDFYEKNDIHIHVPEGAIPKDGPSAGVGMCTALVSVLTGIPVKASVAMTGEITLRGEVLPIGGLKEKLLAARRAGIKTVVIPEENKAELKEIPDNITGPLDIHGVRWIDEVLALALTAVPKPLAADDGVKVTPTKAKAKDSGKPAVQH